MQDLYFIHLISGFVMYSLYAGLTSTSRDTSFGLDFTEIRTSIWVPIFYLMLVCPYFVAFYTEVSEDVQAFLLSFNFAVYW